tara:strand:- start:2229 stop:2735 length:507 start_codon:yes stop_codon:yes gene_type:complete
MTNKEKINQNNEFWDVKKSGQRLLWRMSPESNGECKSFKPNESDFNALKSILGAINRSQEETISNNQLFAKLYIMQLVGDIRENQTTVFNEFIFERLSNQLSKPLDLFYKAFYEDLCSNQLNRITETTTDKEGQEVIVDYNRFKESFSLDFVTSKLDEHINANLNRRS